MTQPVPDAHVSVAIRRPDDESILVLANGTLPAIEVSASLPWQIVHPINEAMRERGMTVTTLRAAWSSGSWQQRLYEVILLAGDPPAGSAWVSPDALGGALSAASTPAAVRAAIADGALTTCDGARQPWYAPRWLDGMADWIDGCLADAGLRRHGPIRQMRSWGRSALLQVETDRGRVWAKEVPASFVHEIAVTGLLADLDPGLVPPLVAADIAACRLLMVDVPGPMLADVADPAAWAATLSRLGETQRVLSTEIDRLAAAGVGSAPLATLADEIPGLLTDQALLRVGLDGGLTEHTIARLQTHAGTLRDACERLGTAGIPDSLDHGDLSASQVIVGEMGPVILDWSDASITHPFLAPAAFHTGPAPARAGMDAVAGPHATDAYLAAWGAALGAATAREAIQAARLVVPLHLARLYRDRILPGLEQPWEVDRVVPELFGTLLSRLDRQAGVTLR